MILRCPACGAAMSLDALVDHDDAARALTLALSMAPLGPQIAKYLGLFRPAKRLLTWARVTALLAELQPAIDSERIERDGRVHDAPLAAWAAGFEKCLQARDSGALRTPLKSHGYLYEIVIAEAARGAGNISVAENAITRAGVSAPQPSAARRALDALEQRKRRDP